MKEVFSVKKFEDSMIRVGLSKSKIESAKLRWANKCDGKTEKEMFDMGWITYDNWMIKVED